MARLRHRDEWFIEIDPRAFYESEFEAVILQNVGLLTANAILIPFKQTVFSSPFESKRADLALIDRDYRFWWVIEVELASHSLFDHVLPQVRVLAEGNYGPEHADALLRESSELDSVRLLEMMRGEPPQVVVISNKYDARWDQELRAAGVTYTVFNVFRSSRNNDIFLFDGSLPNTVDNQVTRLTPAKGIPRFFRVLSPASLPGADGTLINLLINGRQTRWQRIDTSNQCYITPTGKIPVAADRSYIIQRAADGTLILQEEGRKA